MDMFLRGTGWLLFFYAVYCGFLFLMQRQVLFPAGQVQTLPDSEVPVSNIEKIWLDTSTGKVEAWYILPEKKGEDKPFPVVIFAHGNGESIDLWPDILKPLTHLGMGVLLVEYPGYGRSDGSPSQKSITEAFTAAYDHLILRKDIDQKKIIFFGRSIGGGAVCSLAASRKPAAIILMSSFTSIRSFARRYFIPTFLVLDPFDNMSLISSYNGPVLIIHGRHDRIIPYAHGEALYQAALNGQLITYNSGHNDCPPDWDIFWTDIETFLRKSEII